MSTPNHSPVHTVVVGSLVRNDENHVLLIQHHRRGWEIPQGRVEEGEDLLEALHREVREEAGIIIEAGPLAAIWSMVSPPSALIFTFLGRYKSGSLSGGGDSLEAAWFPEEVALDMVSSSVMKERLRCLVTYNGSIMYRSYTLKPYQLHQESVIS